MNRKIAFRAWKPKDSLGDFGYKKGMYNWMHLQDDRNYWMNEDWFDDFVLMQFTGLKDKNGKEMYESDWVSCENGSMGVLEYQEKDMAFKIATSKYDKEGGWSHPIEGFDAKTLEVIGNIYEGKTR